MRLQVLIGCILLNFVVVFAQDQEDDMSVEDIVLQDGEQELVDHKLDEVGNVSLENPEDQDDLAGLQSEHDHGFNMPDTLDTLGFDDSGNWVEKRVYWERAENAYGKLRDTNTQVSQEQLQYFGARNEVDKQLAADHCELGLSKSELTKVLDYLLGLLEVPQDHGHVDQKTNTNDFKLTVLDNQEQLLLLQTNLEQLAQLDSDLDSVIIKAIDQVQKCSEYERKAWEDFKQIGRVLSDESARKLYYQVVSYRKNSKLILNYLKNDLRTSFENLISRVKAKLNQIKKITSELKDAGIDLKYELKALEQDQIYRKDRVQLADTSQNERKSESAKSKKQSGFWGIFLDSLQGLWQLILWLPRKLLGLFGVKF